MIKYKKYILYQVSGSCPLGFDKNWLEQLESKHEQSLSRFLAGQKVSNTHFGAKYAETENIIFTLFSNDQLFVFL